MSYTSIPAIVRKVNECIDAGHEAGEDARDLSSSEANAAPPNKDGSNADGRAKPGSDRE